MTDGDRVGEIKTFWDCIQPRWPNFAAAVLRAQSDVEFLVLANERSFALNRGLEDACRRLHEENARLRMALKQWAEEEPEPAAATPAITARVEETP